MSVFDLNWNVETVLPVVCLFSEFSNEKSIIPKKKKNPKNSKKESLPENLFHFSKAIMVKCH